MSNPPREVRIHKKYGREQTVCGRGIARPAFISDDISKVTCPRCLRAEVAAATRRLKRLLT